MKKTPDDDPHKAALDADIAEKRKPALKLVATTENQKPVVRIKPADLDQTIGLAEQALAREGLHYQYGGLIVFVSTDPAAGTTMLKPTTALAMARVLSALMYFEKFDGRSQSYVLCDPPERVCQVLVASEKYTHLAVLHGLVRQPFFRSTAVLVTSAGYDRPSGMYGVFDAPAFNIPPRPSRPAALQALAELQKLMEKFSFAGEQDAAAAVAACLTSAVRASLPAAPMVLVVAPEAASGKSFLCKVIAGFAGATAPSALSYPTTEEESSKLLLAVLMESPASILFDNCAVDLVPHGSMCSALTEPAIAGRLLGVNKTVSVSTRSMFLASGINCRPLRDLARRCLQIKLDPACERPAERSFKGDPLALMQRNRARYVSLALTIIKAYLAAGRPGLDDLRPLSGYVDWTRLVRAPLIWLGLPDPAGCIFTGLAEDPDREVLGRLLKAWHAAAGEAATSTRELVTASEAAGNMDLADALNEVAADRGTINRRRLGRWISRHEGGLSAGERSNGAAKQPIQNHGGLSVYR